MTRDLRDLLPQTAAKVARVLSRARQEGILLLVTSTYRSFAEQDALYAQGRTAPGRKVTNAKGGQSFHNVRRAVDVVPLDVHGQPDWDATEETWKRIGSLGIAEGLDWGGDDRTFVDKPHLGDRYCARCECEHGHATDFLESGDCKLGF